jgi:hypothetical protein
MIMIRTVGIGPVRDSGRARSNWDFQPASRTFRHLPEPLPGVIPPVCREMIASAATARGLLALAVAIVLRVMKAHTRTPSARRHSRGRSRKRASRRRAESLRARAERSLRRDGGRQLGGATTEAGAAAWHRNLRRGKGGLVEHLLCQLLRTGSGGIRSCLRWATLRCAAACCAITRCAAARRAPARCAVSCCTAVTFGSGTCGASSGVWRSRERLNDGGRLERLRVPGALGPSHDGCWLGRRARASSSFARLSGWG